MSAKHLWKNGLYICDCVIVQVDGLLWERAPLTVVLVLSFSEIASSKRKHMSEIGGFFHADKQLIRGLEYTDSQSGLSVECGEKTTCKGLIAARSAGR